LDRERLLELTSPPRVEVVGNGVDIDYFRPVNEVDGESFRVAFIGRLNAYSNERAVSYIMDNLYHKICAIDERIEFDIVGPNPSEDMINFAHENDRFNLYGAVDDVRPYMNAASVYLCPIADGGGTKLKILDAMASGKAILANPIACEGIDLVDGESVSYASTPDEYIDQFTNLFESEEKRITYGRNARGLAERVYSSKILGRKLAMILSEL
jgi:glycosyltransferase involved in cell wall biosynthesis